MSECTIEQSKATFDSITTPPRVEAYDWHGFVIPVWLHEQMAASGGTSARMAEAMTPLYGAE